MDEHEFLQLLRNVKSGKVANVGGGALFKFIFSSGRDEDDDDKYDETTQLTAEEMDIAKEEFSLACKMMPANTGTVDLDTFKILMLHVIDEANGVKLGHARRAHERRKVLAQPTASRAVPSLYDVDREVAKISAHHRRAVAGASRAAQRKGDAVDHDEEVNKGAKNISAPLFSILATLAAYVLATGLVFSYLEGWDYVDACYFSVIAATTVGYGDFVPSTFFGRWLCVLSLPLCVIFVNLKLGGIGDVIVQSTIFDELNVVLNVDLSLQNLLAMDDDGDVSATK